MYYSTLFLALAGLVSAGGNVLFEGSNYRATVYYGVNDNDVCGEPNGGPFPAKWAETSGINNGYPFCTSKIQAEAKTLAQYNSNRIVALNANMMANDPAYWCGKEVQIFVDGKQILLPEGPFIAYDGCAACTSANIIDLSAEAFTLVSGGTCGNNPEGLTIKVIDNDLSSTLGDAARGSAQGTSPYNPSSGGSSAAEVPASSSAAEAPASSSAAQAPPAETPAAGTPAAEAPPAETPVVETPAQQPSTSATPSAAEASPSPSKGHKRPIGHKGAFGANLAAAESPAPAESSVAAPAVESSAAAPAAESSAAAAPATPAPETPAADCKFGKWQCNGNLLQVCNRKTTTSNSWETIATCPSSCKITISGSADCQ